MALTAPLVILHGYTLYQQNERAEAQAYRSVAARALEEAKAIDAFLTRTENLVVLLAQRADLSTLDPQRCADTFGGMATIDPVYANLGVIANDGALVCASVPQHRDRPAVNFAGAEWFASARMDTAPRLGPPIQSPIEQAPVAILTVPLLDPTGTRVGVVGASIQLHRLAERMFSHGLPPGGSVTLVDERNHVVTRFPEPARWIGQPLPSSVRDARRVSPDGVVTVAGPDGLTRAYATAPIGKHGLRVAVGIPTDYVFAAPRAARFRSYLVAGITLLLATVLAFLFARTLARPLQSLGETVKAWTSGRRGPRADEELPGEFRTLAREFNAMIDAREASEARLVESERRYAAMLDGVDLLAITVALDGQLLYANDALSRLTGWSHDELLTGDWTRLVMPADSTDVFAALRSSAAREVPVPPRQDGVLLTRDGRRRRIRWANAPLHSASGELIGITSIGEDVTERHEAEMARQASARAEAANQAKTEFLAHMSHELRTPLNAVLGFSQLLQLEAGDQLAPAQRQQLDMIHLAGVQLRSLIEDVLDVAQIEAGRLAISLDDAPLQALVDDVIRLSGPNASAERIDLLVDQPVPAVVLRTDPVRLRQVLLNLLSNGIKYNRPGGHVRLTARVDGDDIEIVVTDNGLGMTSEQLRHLFEPFNRLGREHGAIAGTGIGMSLSRQLARLLGGDLVVDSVAAQGTCVTLRLKGVVRSVAPPRSLEPQAVSPGEPTGTVLYIEDNAANTLIVQELLGRWAGVTLHVAPDGRSGIVMARDHRPDLVLLDMRLPDMHGLEVLAALRTDPRTAGIPVVSLSASAMPEEVDAARGAGADAYWTKPLDFAPFLKGVAALLARRTAASAPD